MICLTVALYVIKGAGTGSRSEIHLSAGKFSDLGDAGGMMHQPGQFQESRRPVLVSGRGPQTIQRERPARFQPRRQSHGFQVTVNLERTGLVIEVHVMGAVINAPLRVVGSGVVFPGSGYVTVPVGHGRAGCLQ